MVWRAVVGKTFLSWDPILLTEFLIQRKITYQLTIFLKKSIRVQKS
jgi:hypothetical protein